MTDDERAARDARKHELEAAALLLLLEKRARRLLATAVKVLTAHVIDIGGRGHEVQNAVRVAGTHGASALRAAARLRSRAQWAESTGLVASPDGLAGLGLDALHAARAGDSLARQFGRELALAEGDVKTALAGMGWRINRTATTETVSAWNAEVVRQNDLVTDPALLVVETWSAILDGRTCSECAGMHGQQVTRPDTFAVPPPLHGHCRCLLFTVVRAATRKEAA